MTLNPVHHGNPTIKINPSLYVNIFKFWRLRISNRFLSATRAITILFQPLHNLLFFRSRTSPDAVVGCRRKIDARDKLLDRRHARRDDQEFADFVGEFQLQIFVGGQMNDAIPSVLRKKKYWKWACIGAM